jgi:hypothetical protein
LFPRVTAAARKPREIGIGEEFRQSIKITFAEGAQD